ncbi:Cilia- and flagella-associated protein 45, partial [Coelomomyces lativittatus]
DCISVITRDNIRVLHPHKQCRASKTIVLTPKEMDRIKKNAYVISKDEEAARQEELNKEKNIAAEAAQLRKLRMEEFEKRRTQNMQLSDIELEAKEKANHLLLKAQMQLEEEEEDVKKLNEYMLYSKCVAVRDAQILEKSIINREWKHESRRLDEMMERERQKDVERMEQRELARLEERRRGAKIIEHQILERREAALLEAEKRDQCTKQMLEAMMLRNLQEKEEKQRKLELQKQLMQQVAEANQEAIDRKKIQRQADQEEDRKLLNYLMEREVREIEKDKELQSKKAEREKELARLRAAQKKATDKQSEQDALRAKRAFEAYERDWRRKEKEAAEKKARDEAILRNERAKQQESREHAIEAEAIQMRREFFENLERQKAIEEKIRHEVQVRGEKNGLYNQELKQQILQKEEQKKKEREDFFIEGIHQEISRQDQRKRIQGILERKLRNLRAIGVPEKYCKEVERKMIALEKPRLI